MKSSTIAIIVIVVLIIAGGAWYFTRSAGITSQSSVTTDEQGHTTSAVVLQANTNPKLGAYLASPVTGMTLYTYSKDTTGVTNCTGQCAVNWPPYNVEPGITLTGATGVNGKLASIVRADGGTQLTYNGMPLYTYIKDTKPGDVTGQNVGGVWFVVKP